MGELLFSVLCSAMVSIGMRMSEKRADGSMLKLTMNYVVCALCALLSAGADGLAGPGAGLAMGMGGINGCLCLLGLFMLQYSVAKNGVILSATFMKLGLLVPTVLSLCLFGERPGPLQITGMVLALAAILLINRETSHSSPKAGWVLLSLLFLEGAGLTMSKLFQMFGAEVFEDLFLLFTFLVAIAISTGIALRKKEKLDRWKLLYGFVIGLPNYLSYKFVLRALTKLPAVVVYPTYSVGSLMLVTVAGMAVFREKLTRRQIVAIVIILAALALLNLTA